MLSEDCNNCPNKICACRDCKRTYNHYKCGNINQCGFKEGYSCIWLELEKLKKEESK